MKSLRQGKNQWHREVKEDKLNELLELYLHLYERSMPAITTRIKQHLSGGFCKDATLVSKIGGMNTLNVFVVYCHPSENSFTNIIKNSFLKGLEDAGHTYVISDLYKEGFNPVMSECEYIREGFYRLDRNVSPDVVREQEKINTSDAIVFIYPDFWTASPAMLEGWFQRVWTFGFAYGDSPKMKVLEKALFLITMGGSLQDEIRREQLEAMKTIMVGDRIRNRAKECEVYAFDQMTRGYGNDNNRNERIEVFSAKAYEIAKSL